MQVIDIMIAAVVLTLGNTTVVTKDSDLATVPGLAVRTGPSRRRETEALPSFPIRTTLSGPR
jgi:hypothetical protein